MMNGEREDLDLHRPGVPEWDLHNKIRYFTVRGYDRILIERRSEDVVFAPPPVDKTGFRQ
jgi:hypothetical protein